MKVENGHRRKNNEDRNDLAGEYHWGDAGQILLALIFLIGMCLDVFLLKIKGPFHQMIPFYVQILVAIPLLIISGYLARSGLNIVFGEKRDGLQLIDHGVFSLVRHPIYLGSILLFLSFVFLSLSIVAMIIWIIIVIFYIFISRYEEKILIKKIGKDYEQYMKVVPMFIPRIFRRE